MKEWINMRIHQEMQEEIDGHIYSWPSIWMGSESVHSTNFELKIFQKNTQKIYVVAGMNYVVRPTRIASEPDMYRLIFFVIIPWTMQYKTILHSIYIVVGITSNLEMIYSIREEVHRLYTNTTPFYIGDLSICGFRYPQRSWNKTPVDT